MLSSMLILAFSTEIEIGHDVFVEIRGCQNVETFGSDIARGNKSNVRSCNCNSAYVHILLCTRSTT